MKKQISMLASLMFIFTLFMGLVVTSQTVTAGTAKKAPVMVMDAWVRAVPPSASNSAAYMVVKNTSSEVIRLIGARTEVAKVVEIHEVVKSGGMMEMRPLEGGLAIPAGGSVQLKRGGYHLMIIGLQQKLMEGHPVTVVLEFSDGSEASVQAPVMKGRPMEGGAMKMDGMKMKH